MSCDGTANRSLCSTGSATNRDLRQLNGFEKPGLCSRSPARHVPSEFNPLLPPPGCEPGHWLMLLVDVIKHAYFVGEGVEYLLRSAIDAVYEQCGVARRQTHPRSDLRDGTGTDRSAPASWTDVTVEGLGDEGAGKSVFPVTGLGPVVNVNGPVRASDRVLVRCDPRARCSVGCRQGVSHRGAHSVALRASKIGRKARDLQARARH